jgi:2-isopropylmalate synthase
MIRDLTAQCAAYGCETEFVAEDAGRSEPEFLSAAISAAMAAGASVVTVCDTAGTLLPDEFRSAVAAIRAEIPEGVALGVRCSNELFIAESCAMAAIQAGADEVKTAACGSFTAALDKLTHIIKVRSDAGICCGVRATELQRAVAQIRWMCETNRSKASPFDSGVRDEPDALELTVHDDLSAVMKAAEKLGYDLSEEDGPKVYEAFTRIASRKERVGAKELDAIIASAALQVPPTYRLENYVINSGHSISATCHMQLRKDDKLLESVSLGDGPVDAAFLAIEQIIGRHYELDDFQIQAVTEGREAMGETVVRLRADGKIYAGRGISTDIIGSSIRAYLSAVNKIVYEEGE